MSNADRDALLALIAAYFLTDSQVTDMALSIYTARIDALTSAYADVFATVDIEIPDDWGPDPALLEDIAKQSQDNAQSVADTYKRDLTAVALTFVETQGVFNAAQLIAAVTTWATTRLTWKSQQIAQYETGAGMDAGTRAAIDDAIAQVPDLAGEDSPYSVICLPDGAEEPRCLALLGQTYSLSEASSLPLLPMHANCPHYYAVVFGR